MFERICRENGVTQRLTKPRSATTGKIGRLYQILQHELLNVHVPFTSIEDAVDAWRKGPPTWRVVRYADDFAVLVNGSGHDAEALREQIADVLAGLGLRFSDAKTRATHMSEGSVLQVNQQVKPCGAPGGRTLNQRIKSPLLCH